MWGIGGTACYRSHSPGCCAITNWLFREYRNVSEGEGNRMVTFGGLVSVIKIMPQTVVVEIGMMREREPSLPYLYL